MRIEFKDFRMRKGDNSNYEKWPTKARFDNAAAARAAVIGLKRE